jgi:hypothetical protein
MKCCATTPTANDIANGARGFGANLVCALVFDISGGSLGLNKYLNLSEPFIADAGYEHQMFRSPKRAVSLPKFDDPVCYFFSDEWNRL